MSSSIRIEKLWIDDKNPTLEKLRRRPKLRLIKFARTGQPPPGDCEPIEKFWMEYDEQHLATPK